MSNNGLGPIRIFNSYEDMLIGDGFPHGFIDEKGYPIGKASSIPETAVIGEKIVFTEKDIKGPPPPLK